MKKFLAADLFCGAGGSSSGLIRACRKAGIPLQLLAINHWQVAIDTHSENHPEVQHLCESVDNVDPRKVVPGGRLHLLIAGIECTHHSNARGGRPMNDQSRSAAWQLVRWAEALYIDTILIENVREFRSWGPLGANGRPIKKLAGQTYQAFLNALRSLGYVVEERLINAANYGDPTTRERLFIMARRGGKKIVWPDATHTQKPSLFGQKPWRAAREIIDWKFPSQSIFTRKRPLSPKTMERIIAGLRKFGGASLEPFLVVLRNHGGGRSVERPMPTLTAGGQHVGLCEPFLLGQQSKACAREVSNPVPTVATKGAIALVEPYLVTVNHGEDGSASHESRTHSVDDPTPTVTTKNGLALCEPFIVPFFGEREGQDPRTHSVDEPLPTVTGHGAGALAQPFLTKFYKTATGAQSVEDPLDTVTTKDRFGLVLPEINGQRLDIRFRMLQPHELAAAQGFDTDYKFKGNRSEVVKQIGNAWAGNLATALCSAIVKDYNKKPSRTRLSVVA